MKTVVLVGGGHAHLSVLRQFSRHRAKLARHKVVFVTPSTTQFYSGMLPSYMAGHYDVSDCQIALEPLAAAAGAELVLASVAALDADEKRLVLDTGETVSYDVVSLNTGSETNVAGLEMSGDKLLAVKPLATFFHSWPRVASEAALKPTYRLIVIGGGVAAVELALAARHALSPITRVEVELIIPERGMLSLANASLRDRVRAYLDRAGVAIRQGPGVATSTGLGIADGQIITADRFIAATGARAPRWVSKSGLEVDAAGFIAVDDHHRSRSHATVYAVGDICSRRDVVMERSGVHAVYAGPVVGANVLAELSIGTSMTYAPPRRPLYILACGPRYAIAAWGSWSAEGRWVWYWKDMIDRGFIRRFS